MRLEQLKAIESSPQEVGDQNNSTLDVGRIERSAPHQRKIQL